MVGFQFPRHLSGVWAMSIWHGIVPMLTVTNVPRTPPTDPGCVIEAVKCQLLHHCAHISQCMHEHREFKPGREKGKILRHATASDWRPSPLRLSVCNLIHALLPHFRDSRLGICIAYLVGILAMQPSRIVTLVSWPTGNPDRNNHASTSFQRNDEAVICIPPSSDICIFLSTSISWEG